MSDVLVRKEGRAGRITLNRPEALNALNHQMCLTIEAALRDWAKDDDVALVILEGAGPRAFCSGGDVAAVALAGQRGDAALGRAFWRDEYRLNLMLAEGWGKPVVSFLHGFVMGGGVGLGCHIDTYKGGARIVGESTQIAMPECGIGLIPDVGGTFLLSCANGTSAGLGTYLGLTADRMNAADALFLGFADCFVPEDKWDELKRNLIRTGDLGWIKSELPPKGPLQLAKADISRLFAGDDVSQIIKRLEGDPSDLAAKALKAMGRNSPLSMVSTLKMLERNPKSVAEALAQEFRWTWRAVEASDFVEGVRAQLIDKDRNPRWKHSNPAEVTDAEVEAMLAPLGEMEWEAVI